MLKHLKLPLQLYLTTLPRTGHYYLLNKVFCKANQEQHRNQRCSSMSPHTSKKPDPADTDSSSSLQGASSAKT